MEDRAVKNLNMYTVNLPEGIEITEGMRWYGPGPMASVLVIEIADDIKPGQYTFGIGIEIQDRDYGTMECTIDVIMDDIASQDIPWLNKAGTYQIIEEANLVNEDPVRTAGLWLITSEDASGFEEYAQTTARAVLDLYHRYGRDYTSVILVPSADIRIPSYAHASFAADGRGPAGMTGSAPASAFYWKVRASDRELNEREIAIAKLWSDKQQDFPQPNPLMSSLTYDEEALRQYIADTLNIPYDEAQMPRLEMCEYDLEQLYIDGMIAPSEKYVPGNYGITTTKIEREPGDNGTSVNALMIKLTTDDLVEHSDAIIIGEVIDILPSRKVDCRGDDMVITDVVIKVERYLYGNSQSPYIAVMVFGGQVGDTKVWVEDQPVFTLGEKAALFLNFPEFDAVPPEGFNHSEYFSVTGSFQGKLEYTNGDMVTSHGDHITFSGLEQKIAEAKMNN
jgi:hypothetical protein